MKIVVLDGYTLNPGDLSWDKLEALGELVIYDRTPNESIVERIGDAEIILTNKTPIDACTIKAAKHLKYIGVLATGYNIVDINSANAHGITVCNVPTYSTDSVAQFVFALLLDICHRVSYHSESVKSGEWQNCQDFCYWKSPLFELKDKTIGLVGYGKIGKRVAELARAFGMNIIVYHHRTQAGTKEDDIAFVSLDTLFKEADIISLHVPLFEQTKHIIDASAIEKMKTGVIIVNTSRGPLLDEHAVAHALEKGKIGHLAVDVVSEEPIKGTNPLLKSPNTTITPHIAWAPFEARVRLMDTTVNNIKHFLKDTPINKVNKN